MASDPRLDRTDAGERDVMPMVARPRAGLPGWAIAVALGVVALLLFGVLDARRRSLQVPAVAVRPLDETGLPSTPPALEIPPEPAPIAPAPFPLVVPPPAPRPTPAAPVIVRAVPRTPVFAPVIQQAAPALPARSGNTGGPAVVVDSSTPRAASSQNDGRAPAGGVGSTDRARASMFANRSTTVSQGTLIHAVLETAFNSTRVGFARALVSRDVASFDGSRVLIPRGSRLIGEYQSDAAPGQNRALVIWNRLIRPDGAVIAIASPAADPLGRGGVKADVNTHFLERFSGAILQSALDVGVNLASRSNNGTVVLALPNSAQTIAPLNRQTNIPPTLSVKAGTSIGVFVARDLDFTDVEASQ